MDVAILKVGLAQLNRQVNNTQNVSRGQVLRNWGRGL